jgi:hypothetical protein
MGVLSILKVVFSKAISFLVFIIVLMCLNVLIPLVNNLVFTNVVGFLNVNIMILFMSALFMLFAGVFDELSFPLNLPAPLLNAIGSLFIVGFFLKMFYFISQSTPVKVYLYLESVYGLIYLCVFLAVLLAGYLDILHNLPSGGWARRSRVFEKSRKMGEEPNGDVPEEAEEDSDDEGRAQEETEPRSKKKKKSK